MDSLPWLIDHQATNFKEINSPLVPQSYQHHGQMGRHKPLYKDDCYA